MSLMLALMLRHCSALPAIPRAQVRNTNDKIRLINRTTPNSNFCSKWMCSINRCLNKPLFAGDPRGGLRRSGSPETQSGGRRCPWTAERLGCRGLEPSAEAPMPDPRTENAHGAPWYHHPCKQTSTSRITMQSLFKLTEYNNNPSKHNLNKEQYLKYI